MEERAIVVVHGVGDPEPGDALSGFSSAYCVVSEGVIDVPLTTQRWEDRAHEDASGMGPIPLFPVSRLGMRTAVPGDGQARRTRLYEVYWGDLSRVKGSLLGLLEGAIDLVFGLRHVVFAAQRELRAAARQDKALSVLARVIAAMSTAALWVARGPVLALNILAFVASVLYAAIFLASKQGASGLDPALAAIAVGAPLTLLIGFISFRAAKESEWTSTTAESLMFVGAGAALAALWRGRGYSDYGEFANDLTIGLSLFAAILALCILVLIAASAMALVSLKGRRARRSRESALHARQAIVVINVCTIMSSALFVLLVMLAWTVAWQQIDAPEMLEFRNRIEQGLHLFGLVWASFIVIAVAYGCLMFRSFLLQARKPASAGKFPRFIVHPSVVAILVASGIAWTMLFLPLAYQLECRDALERYLGLSCADLSRQGWYERTITAVEKATPFCVAASGVVASLLVAAHAHLGTALDIVLDVISHFKRHERTAWQVLFGRHDAGESSTGERVDVDNDPQAGLSSWDAMVARFDKVLKSAIEETGCKRLTVIAHSQGTMIALEALGVIRTDRREGDAAPRKSLAPEVQCDILLVTMGCPLSDLYIHYFPGRYAINPRQESVVGRWINIYRADDFVGKAVSNPADAAHPRNVEVGPRGHVDYWTDREVLTAIRDEALA